MPVYSVKNDETLAIRAFSSSRAAYDFGSRQQVFSNDGELYNTCLTDDQLRDVYYLVTGFETRVQYRDYLCELIFNAIEAAGLPLTDKENDCAIVSAVEPVDNEPVDLANEPVDYLNETEEREPIEDTVPGIVHLIPEPSTPVPEPKSEENYEYVPECFSFGYNKNGEFFVVKTRIENGEEIFTVDYPNRKPPTPDHDPTTMEPDLSFIEPEPTTNEPPAMDPDPAAILDLIVNEEIKDKEEEIQKQFENLVIYGVSNPEIYKTLPKIDKKDLVLSDTPKTKYSRREKSIFETIVEAYPEPITTRDIIERKFKSYKKYHVKNAIAVTTKSLANKIAYNEEPFLLKIGGKSGPKPMFVWIEERGE